MATDPHDIDALPADYRDTHAERLVAKRNRVSSRTLTQAKFRAVAQWADGNENAEIAMQGRLSGALINAREHDTIQDAIDRAVVVGSSGVYIPPGHYLVASSIDVPDDMTIVAAPGARVLLPAGATFAAFDLDGVSRVRLVGIRVELDTTAAGSGGYAVHVRGDATDITIENCEAIGTAGGFIVRGEDGTIAGTCRRVVFDRCRANDSTALWGFEASECEAVAFERCHADSNWLDGFKIRRMTFGTTIRGCTSTNNGQDPGNAGDGIDAFAGGDTFVISDCICEDNLGNGITIKTDSLTQSDAATYGWIRNVQVTNVICRRNDPGYGMGIYAFRASRSSQDLTMPLVQHCVVLGGVFQDNRETGLWLDAHNLVCVAPIVRGNGEHGIEVGTQALNVTLRDPMVVANGVEAGTWNGIYLRGRHVRLYGGHVFGVDPDQVFTDAELAAATPTHARNIYVDSTFSADVEIHDPIEDYNVTGVGVITDMTSGHCVIHQRGAGSPVGVAYGGIGSIWTQTDTTDGVGARWEKTTGAPNVRTGWVRRVAGRHNQAVVAGDFALHANWGTGASVSVDAGSTEESGRIVVTVGTTPGSQPTVSLTFPGGAYAVAPRIQAWRNQGNASNAVATGIVYSSDPSTTVAVFFPSGTPTAGTTLGISYRVTPRSG